MQQLVEQVILCALVVLSFAASCRQQSEAVLPTNLGSVQGGGGTPSLGTVNTGAATAKTTNSISQGESSGREPITFDGSGFGFRDVSVDSPNLLPRLFANSRL